VIQAIASGLALGSIYALVAMGFYVTYKASNTMNFGQGDAVVLAGMTLAGVMSAWAVGYAFAVVFTVVILAVYGALVYLVTIRPLRELDSMRWIITTLGFGLITANIMALVWGATVRPVPTPLPSSPINILGAGIFPSQVLVIIACAVLTLALSLAVNRTRLGYAFKTVAYSHDVAKLNGVNVAVIIFGAFALSGVLAGLAGILVGPISNIGAYIGLPLALKGFAAAIVGGLENPSGVYVGGLLIGLLEAFALRFTSDFGDVVVFAAMIIVIAIRPQGLFAPRKLRVV
jgi:branched-chain amino acid transport system permease protein